MSSCPFCRRLDAKRGLLVTNGPAAAFLDEFPVSRGHALVVPRRHGTDLFDLPDEEWEAVWKLVRDVRSLLKRMHSPAGWNVGVNIGHAGGQTIEHAHVHVIPRYEGDAVDPRGGVRWVLPEKAPYWNAE